MPNSRTQPSHKDIHPLSRTHSFHKDIEFFKFIDLKIITIVVVLGGGLA